MSTTRSTELSDDLEQRTPALTPERSAGASVDALLAKMTLKER